MDATETDPVEAIRDATDGVGVDVAFEAVGGIQDHLTDGTDPVAQAFRMLRSGGTLVPVGQLADEVTLDPGKLRKKYVNVVSPRDKAGIVALTPNADSGDLAARLVADGRVSISEYATRELAGLDSFDRAVAETLGWSDTNALGPPQVVLSDD